MDGRTLIVGVNTGGDYDVHTLAFGEDSTTQPLLADPALREVESQVSPNGRWIAYMIAPPTAQVYVRPYPEVDTARVPVSGAGVRGPVWSPDGRQLFFRSGVRGEFMMAVSVETDGPEFRAGIPQVLFEGEYLFSSPSGRIRAWDLAEDGRFLMVKESTSESIVVVQNWFEELSERVPAR